VIYFYCNNFIPRKQICYKMEEGGVIEGADTNTSTSSWTASLPADAALIKQGAEARVYRATFLGQQVIIKERFCKTYRHPILDKKLNQRRITQEARCLAKIRAAGIGAPGLIFADIEALRLYLEFVEGTTARDYLLARSHDHPEAAIVAELIGSTLGRMHDANIVHGDLTTSNMIISPDTSLVLIDFGLSYITRNAEEDEAVDLYVLERAFLSTHPNSEGLFSLLLEAYGRTAKKGQQVLNRLEQVRLRGRKKLAFG
jgi:TP53 regulating kinase-like protein